MPSSADYIRNFWDEFGDDRYFSLEEQVSRMRHHYANTVGAVAHVLEMLDDHVKKIQENDERTRYLENKLLGEKGRENDSGLIGAVVENQNRLMANQQKMQWMIVSAAATIIVTIVASVAVFIATHH